MGIAERKGRERAERQQRITAAAREIAEREGWSAVTIRRLADTIEYSQPVLYAHFANRDAIVAAVAIAGFRDLAAALRDGAKEAEDRQQAIEAVAATYLAFARAQPALYEAMFTLPTDLHFADSETRPELRDAFAALSAAVAPSNTEPGVATETFWATLHGLAALERSGRIRDSARRERLALVVAWAFAS
ncbi:TetR/AcrR family transcriptional regulator [Lichenihabitans sp. Uapishka_5]|uniref:TetR/AcrR family transcriptional regulator n=1 Tax=Lichenihabitans sp. Uapishka_5 TaxID=3037302 RepID=UPI0029E7D320|nr:TetR/AcrR family transcriptional regulator [Lichenihabitans sp. Uapishka_5]MDX7951469.1 TetR/AcrR family transcriptional regulator [Lichenihabitans sp. Uapishka_5]